MPTYKLQYFEGRALGELSRYVFHAAGQDFEDIRFNHSEWETIKPCKYLSFYLIFIISHEQTQ